jgi:hypothetical protein
MGGLSKHILPVFAALAFFATTPAIAADDDGCALTRVASFDIVPSRNDAVVISAKIAGHDELMSLSTASPMSALTPTTADELGLKRAALSFGDWRMRNGMGLDVTGVWMGRNYVTLQGKELVDMAYAPTLQLGNLVGKDVPFSILLGDNKETAGSIGTDILSRYDVELDFAANKVNFFAHQHCEGKVVYWTRQRFASARFHPDRGYHIMIPVELDGASLTAVIATGVTDPLMKLETARSVFGWHSEPPELTPDTHRKGDFDYPFKTLSFAGATVHNPTVKLADEDLHMKADMLLGLSALKAFHVYIAYYDQTIYLTARDAH